MIAAGVVIVFLTATPTAADSAPMLEVSHWSGPMPHLGVTFHSDGRIERDFPCGYTHASRLGPRDRYRLAKFMDSPNFEAALRGLDEMRGPEYTCTEDVSIRVRGRLYGYTIPATCPTREVVEFVRLLNEIMIRRFGSDAQVPIERLICSKSVGTEAVNAPQRPEPKPPRTHPQD